jgi:hypothetical protein
MKDLLFNWKEGIFIIKPSTVIKWHKIAFRLYWKRKNGLKGGRPKINRKVIYLIKQMANENPLWGAPRIHGELKKLGVEVSESTIQRYMFKRGGRTIGQRWKTFLKNLTSYRSPWQNGYVERVIGSIKRECLDHLIIMNEDHLAGTS